MGIHCHLPGTPLSHLSDGRSQVPCWNDAAGTQRDEDGDDQQPSSSRAPGHTDVPRAGRPAHTMGADMSCSNRRGVTAKGSQHHAWNTCPLDAGCIEIRN